MPSALDTFALPHPSSAHIHTRIQHRDELLGVNLVLDVLVQDFIPIDPFRFQQLVPNAEGVGFYFVVPHNLMADFDQQLLCCHLNREKDSRLTEVVMSQIPPKAVSSCVSQPQDMMGG